MSCPCDLLHFACFSPFPLTPRLPLLAPWLPPLPLRISSQGQSRVRAVVKIHDISRTDISPDNYEAESQWWLDDPYEGRRRPPRAPTARLAGHKEAKMVNVHKLVSCLSVLTGNPLRSPASTFLRRPFGSPLPRPRVPSAHSPRPA